MAAREDSWRLPPPSLGVSDNTLDDKARMEKEAVEWLNPQNKKRKKKEEVEDPDFDPREWDVDRMTLSELNKELKRMEEAENE